MRLVSYLSPGFPEELFETMASVIGADVVFERTLSGPAPGEDPFADASVDLGWVCSTSYVERGLDGPAPTVQLVGVAWVPADPGSGGRPVYFGDVVVPMHSPLRTFDDLAGRTVGCNDPVSLSGHWALRLEAIRRGHDPETFADLHFTGGHHRSLDLIVDGALDAAVVDSVVRTTRARTDSAVDGLRVIDRLGPWPVQPLVARSSMPAAEVATVREELLAAADRPDVRQALATAGLGALVAVGPDHYDQISTALAATATR